MLNIFNFLVIKFPGILLSFLYSFRREGGDCIMMYLIQGELLQIYDLRSDLATCMASGCGFCGSGKQRSDRWAVTARFQNVACRRGLWSPYFCREKTSTLTFVGVAFCLSAIKAA